MPRAGDDDLVGTFFFWRQLLSTAEQHLLAAIAFLAAGLCLGLGIAQKATALRVVGFALAVVWLVVVLPLLAPQPNEPAAVLVQAETVLRAADSSHAPARLAQALPAGTEVTIVEQRESWDRIRLADGETGWVPTGSTMLLRPALER